MDTAITFFIGGGMALAAVIILGGVLALLFFIYAYAMEWDEEKTLMLTFVALVFAAGGGLALIYT